VLWLDGADATTMYDATTGGSLVSANAAVARWEDKSGNGRHFTQASGGFRPTRKEAVKNGLNAINFTGNYLVGAHAYTAGTIFIAWSQATVSASFSAILWQTTSGTVLAPNGVMTLAVSQTTNVNRLTGGFTGIESGEFRLNGQTPSILDFSNFNVGVPVRTTPDRWQYTSLVFPAVTGSHSFTIGADARFSTGRFLQNSHIGEMIAYSGTLSPGQVATVERYLIRKWGLA
jgi:hypothetical protein